MRFPEVLKGVGSWNISSKWFHILYYLRCCVSYSFLAITSVKCFFIENHQLRDEAGGMGCNKLKWVVNFAKSGVYPLYY